MRDFATVLEAELADLAALDRRRSCPEVSGASRTALQVGDERLLSFCTNDYLGLAFHPDLGAAAARAGADEGWGASAARLVSGDLPAHRALERALAAYLSFYRTARPCCCSPRATRPTSALLTALAGRDDLIVSDALNHASLIDGCRLSRAQVSVYPHGDAAGRPRGPARRRRRSPPPPAGDRIPVQHGR